jgi:hypothetical protein
MDSKLLTVLYADIFDYPLTRDELNRWMIMSRRRIPRGSQHYYFLKGRQRIVTIRKERTRRQREKWDIARRAAKILSGIHSILLVGVTGGLAMNNARESDDIDFFLIVEDGTIWISRLLSVILLSKLRRKRNETRVANKICLNMFISDAQLSLPDTERDLFSAHEVLQMQPLYNRDHTYKKFLYANEWVQKFLPNAWQYRIKI